MQGSHIRLLVVACLAAVAAGAAVDTREAGARAELAILELTDGYRRETWRWQSLMGLPRTPTSYGERRSSSPRYRGWVLGLWKKRAAKARRLAARPPHRPAWLCIHRYEGPWDDPDPPYYGGLQMDLDFQRRYGRDLLRRKGTADRWTPLEQMWVAARAHRSGRGFYPWPNTARICGLI